jgi:predicted house-cleaning noncanonical NTP pyrophosphatase (MazG superfamily)
VVVLKVSYTSKLLENLKEYERSYVTFRDTWVALEKDWKDAQRTKFEEDVVEPILSSGTELLFSLHDLCVVIHELEVFAKERGLDQ